MYEWILKGSARRKKKVVHKSNVTDDKKIQMVLKKIGVNNIPGIEEVIVFYILISLELFL